MSPEATYDWIQGYLNNTLTASEKAAFEARLTEDEAFSEEVETHRISHEIIMDNALLDIKQQIQTIHREHTGGKSDRIRRLWIGLGILALIAVVAAILLFYYKLDKTVNVGANTTIRSKPDPKREPGSDTITVLEIAPVNIGKSEDQVPLRSAKLTTVAEEVVDSVLSEDAMASLPTLAQAVDSVGPLQITQDMDPQEISDNEQEVIDEYDDPQPDEPKSIADCEGITIELRFSIANSCEGRKDGAIVFEAPVFEGTPPFNYSIDGGRTFLPTTRFEGRSIGRYGLVIEDSKGCQSEPVEGYIEKKDCDFIIAPDQQKYWEIPLEDFDGEQVEIKILSARTGEVVYLKTLSSASLHTWNGTDQNHSPLTMGNYVYVISSKESSKTETGQITIVQ